MSEDRRRVPRPDYDQYADWARESLNIDWREVRYRQFYELNAQNAVKSVEEHQFFQDIAPVLTGFGHRYNSCNPTQLLTSRPEVNLLWKPFNSAVNKSYRLNILRNERFPDPPPDGRCVPERIFERLNDIVRGLIVCRYIDGPAFLAHALSDYAKQLELAPRFVTRQNDAGYYAYHLYVHMPITIRTLEWMPQDIHLPVEIQLTTQLQEVLKGLTHGFYEEWRLLPSSPSDDWKWQFDTPRFKGSYIGHTLHLLEGVILALKDEVEAKNGAPADDDQG